MPLQSYLTLCIYQLGLESQLPPKIVNLLLTITDENIKLTVLRGSHPGRITGRMPGAYVLHASVPVFPSHVQPL